MQRKPSLMAAVLLAGLTLFQGFLPSLQAQTAPPPPQQDAQLPPPPTPEELDQLLSPVALYPDSLLAQITTASTNPQEILDVNSWISENQGLTGTALTNAAQQQGFDPAFIALVNFPTVLQMMADHIDDYAAIGAAVTANQGEVAASIQRLRSDAYASGALRTNPEQQVIVQQDSGQPVYAIQPVNPQVVYVPQYDPTVVYAGVSNGDVVAASLLSFGVGIGIGALLVNNQPWGWGGWGWNWGRRSIYYNRGPWGGWHGGYRPSRPWYRPRPVIYGNRPGYRGNWAYRPNNYRPPNSGNRPGYNRPGYNRPGYNRPANSPTYRPGGNNNRPGNGTGYRPGNGNQPGNRPGNGNQTGYRPGNGNRPGNNNRPQPNRPATQSRPAPQNRPTQERQPRSQQQSRPQHENRSQQQSRPQQQNRPQQHGRSQQNNRKDGGGDRNKGKQ